MFSLGMVVMASPLRPWTHHHACQPPGPRSRSPAVGSCGSYYESLLSTSALGRVSGSELVADGSPPPPPHMAFFT